MNSSTVVMAAAIAAVAVALMGTNLALITAYAQLNNLPFGSTGSLRAPSPNGQNGQSDQQGSNGRPSQTIQVIHRTNAGVDIPPMQFITTSVSCNAGEIATGGGYSETFVIGPPLSQPPYAVSSAPLSSNSGWSVTAFNPAGTIAHVAADVQCAMLVPH